MTELKHKRSAPLQPRQYLFVGDIEGTIQGFCWNNWTDMEARLRNKRNKRQDREIVVESAFTPMKPELQAHGSEQAITASNARAAAGVFSSTRQGRMPQGPSPL